MQITTDLHLVRSPVSEKPCGQFEKFECLKLITKSDATKLKVRTSSAVGSGGVIQKQIESASRADVKVRIVEQGFLHVTLV